MRKYHDNDSKPACRLVNKFLNEEMVPSMMKWSSQSSYLNPIENLRELDIRLVKFEKKLDKLAGLIFSTGLCLGPLN